MKDIPLRGSFTLESSIIFPMTILISIFIILYAFFVHDKLVIKSSLYNILIEDYADGSSTSFSSTDITERLKTQCLLSHTYNLKYQSDKYALQLQTTSSYNSHILLDLSFTGYERCDFIRKNYTFIKILKERKE